MSDILQQMLLNRPWLR